MVRNSAVAANSAVIHAKAGIHRASSPLNHGSPLSRGQQSLCLAGLAFMLTLVALPASAETLRVGKAGREAFSFVAADVGAAEGLYKKNGLDIEISSFGGDARLQQAMTADGIDVGLGSGPGLAFVV